MFFSTHTLNIRRALKGVLFILAFVLPLSIFAGEAKGSTRWSAKLDAHVRFYQATELGVLVLGTEKSLYGVDAETGEVLWRRKNVRLDETDVAPVPGTDLLLLSLEQGDKSRLEALDLMTGDALWRSEKVRGSVMQMALDQNTNLLAVVLVRDARDHVREGFKRHPVVHLFDLGAGKELWKYEIESEVEMMPARWSEDGDVSYTLDNYRAPAFLDDHLYLFYEGVTSLDERTGKERRREKFRVNEEGLALTDADPTMDERYIYASGRGHVRAISRSSGDTVWESKDLGLTPEMVLTRDVLYVRTGGRFTRLKNGEVAERGPYGVSAIDVENGKILWRYKGADKGITNILLNDAQSITVADRDDLILLDAATGKRRAKTSHEVERAAFVLLNERGQAVVGGDNEVAAFDTSSGRNEWRSKHDPPGRGLLRTVAAIAARATSLYFRYGGAATTVFRGAQLLNAASTLRWSGLSVHAALPNLTSLAENYARDSVRDRFNSYGVLSRIREASNLSPNLSTNLRVPIRTPSSAEVQERLLDRLDPATQLERLSRFLWRRKRLASLHGEWMYFYTDLKGRVEGHGLLGVNLNAGAAQRAIRLNNPDDRFISDETTNLLYVSHDDQLIALELNDGR
ncbi:MAG TPA: PQQ-binding-like beta-propeller repeat protein [Pyrinomonadaceae bacterium]|nr:PQQ-binding-like beta-propeller repeat protein [Pyrinomonadaceae bacterium]